MPDPSCNTTLPVDIRVQRNIVGERPHALRKSDLPIVARAILSVVRGQAIARTGVSRHMPYVLLTGKDLNLSILGSDWEKILPWIQDGTFNPIQVPTSPVTGWLHPDRHYDGATLDTMDPRFYERILHVLEGLFPDDYPTSNL